MKLAVLFLSMAFVVLVQGQSQYLPPSNDIGEAPPPQQEYLPPGDEPAGPGDEPENGHELADDGYRYKKVRRVRYRFRV